MSNPGITKYFREYRESFLKTSKVYLDLYHGDTSSHPYVTDFHAAVHADTKPVAVAKEKETAPTVSPSNAPVIPQLSWHGRYCLKKFGKTTPGF